MSIWLMILFAFCMISGVATVETAVSPQYLAGVPFVASLMAFVAGLWRRGIRRPVV